MVDTLASLSCGLPFAETEQILLSHGSGGKMMQQLIRDMFLKNFANPILNTEHDAAVLPSSINKRLALTTDSYVIKPLFFPGGDIGKLSVFGTVNDLAMSGAKPLYLSVAMILEAGFPMQLLQKIVISMQQAAEICNVQIVTGDTKVVEHGKGDGIFINTSGIGVIEHDLLIQPNSIQPGDAIIVSGDLGRHGIAIMAAREGLNFESNLQSDCASLSELVQTLLAAKINVHCLRDLTRGGLSSALNEIANKNKQEFIIEEAAITVQPQVFAACEMLGLDPLYVANEGRLVAFVPAKQAELTVKIMRQCITGVEASCIGYVRTGVYSHGKVILKNKLGVSRILSLLSGEQLPRIC